MKDLYRQLCEFEPSIPLFSRAWWLDAVAGEDWDVVMVEKGGSIIAAMPYVWSQRYGFTVISQPPLTQTQGPWIKSSGAKYAKRLSREKDLMEALIKQLPRYHHFSQNWHFEQTNWLPFYWQGFSQTTRYTYRISDLQSKGEKDIWSEFQQNIRTDIKKALNREHLVVRDDLPLDSFYQLNAMVFQRQRKKVPYPKAFVEKLDKAACQRGCRKVFIAEDEYGRHHAGVYIVWDQNSAYYIMGGGNPDLRNSGATSLCMWEAIKFSSKVTRSFDFEGSMLEPVERFFRSFGAVQTPYFNISHSPSKSVKCINAFREILKS